MGFDQWRADYCAGDMHRGSVVGLVFLHRWALWDFSRRKAQESEGSPFSDFSIVGHRGQCASATGDLHLRVHRLGVLDVRVRTGSA